MAAARTLVEEIARLEQRRGLLIVFEGPDGSGKTTQRKLFKTWLRGEGKDVLTTKWNSSPLIKPLIKPRKSTRSLSPAEFSLLHACDFRHRLENEILPALCQGQTVLADRYLFTALARDVARGLDLDWVLELYAPLFFPDLVFYFSVSPQTSGRRIAAERVPSFYEAGQDVTHIPDPHASYQQFIGRVIREYSALATIFRFVTIDAEQSIYDQHKLIRKMFQEAPRQPWTEHNTEAIADWLTNRPEVRLG